MPMLDAYIPQGALPAEDEMALLRTLTDVLLEHEGVDSSNPAARALAKVWLHRPATVLHAGEEPAAPHYRVIASVPEGQFDDERRASMVAAVTEAILTAENGRYDRDPLRIWVFANEIPDGTWGGAVASRGWPTLPRSSRATRRRAAPMPSVGSAAADRCRPKPSAPARS